MLPYLIALVGQLLYLSDARPSLITNFCRVQCSIPVYLQGHGDIVKLQRGPLKMTASTRSSRSGHSRWHSPKVEHQLYATKEWMAISMVANSSSRRMVKGRRTWGSPSMRRMMQVQCVSHIRTDT
ncbi:hypothetical protein EDD85DRAFT_155576 [Armillaria nabsnona]|nr:hypothetical protein EDD85DRAFT_155576 [Armillaria nabsnona]